MKTKAKRPPGAAPLTAFWDTSAIVPLCCYQSRTSRARQLAGIYARQVVWWGTPVETSSSLNRLIREGYLTAQESPQAFARLENMRRRWNEIQPLDQLRGQAERLLGIHKLRAADALQLAAALGWCAARTRGRHFICADNDLSQAAEAEGFSVIRI